MTSGLMGANMTRIGILVLTTLGMLIPGCAAGGEVLQSGRYHVASRDFQFEMDLYGKLPPCEAQSGEHIHGFYISLDDSNCKQNSINLDARSYGIYANFNTTFIRNSENILPDDCRSAVREREIENQMLELLRQKFSQVSACATRKESGTIDLNVTFQADEWNEVEPENEGVGRINYLLWMQTNSASYSLDLRALKSSLATLTIGNE